MPPVDDHPVHVKTQIKSDKPYGCYDHPPRSAGYNKAVHEINHHGEFALKTVWIPYVMSTECRYDMAGSDGRCCGCKHNG